MSVTDSRYLKRIIEIEPQSKAKYCLREMQ